jgi:hypothetical protein
MNFLRAMIVLMIEAVRTSETSVNLNVTTRRYIPEGSNLHTRRRENLKSHTSYMLHKEDAIHENKNTRLLLTFSATFFCDLRFSRR